MRSKEVGLNVPSLTRTLNNRPFLKEPLSTFVTVRTNIMVSKIMLAAHAGIVFCIDIPMMSLVHPRIGRNLYVTLIERLAL